jgi:hypothetical protein
MALTTGSPEGSYCEWDIHARWIGLTGLVGYFLDNRELVAVDASGTVLGLNAELVETIARQNSHSLYGPFNFMPITKENGRPKGKIYVANYTGGTGVFSPPKIVPFSTIDKKILDVLKEKNLELTDLKW